MRTTLAATIMLATVLGCVGTDQEVSIDQIVPQISQLGEGWSSNRIVVLVDPLSSPKEMADKSESSDTWLANARTIISKSRREAYAVLRYYYGPAHFLVVINRWKSKGDIGANWKREKETKPSPGPLPKIGEEVRFSQRHGLHNITFRRGRYLIDVESTSGGIEQLKQLASALDANLKQPQPKTK